MFSIPTPLARPVKGAPFVIGDHFDALNFNHAQFDGAMNPLLMVDHFRMREPTFGPHPHAGFSAVTYVFEDSRSPHLNRDSIGNDCPIHPGSLHWMVAGRGVVHDEWPGGENPETHGLQIFVNLPEAKRGIDPYALHVEAEEIPVYEVDGIRVRVVVGRYGELQSPAAPPQDFLLFDVFLDADRPVELAAIAGGNAWVHVVKGRVSINGSGPVTAIDEGYSVAIPPEFATALVVEADAPSQFVMMSGIPVGR
jgi:redox-sensitive bicupin YhaK (pirin superfamily)